MVHIEGEASAASDAPGAEGCAFCGIASGALPRRVRYQDAELIAFRNALDWAPVMHLVAPVAHMSQAAFWRSPLFARAAALAVELGEADAPGGFRVVSNFGNDAMQSQPHGHLHVLGGAHLGLYMDFPSKSDFWLRFYGTAHPPGASGGSSAASEPSVPADAQQAAHSASEPSVPAGARQSAHSDSEPSALADAQPLASSASEPSG